VYYLWKNLILGPENYGQAAICFYKALKVYPAPAELVMVFQKTIPPEVFTVVMGMLSKDVSRDPYRIGKNSSLQTFR